MINNMTVKLIPALLAAALASGISAPSDAAVLTGDVNGDSFIDPADATMILEEYSLLSVGKAGSFGDGEKAAADVTGDGLTDASDASAILTYYTYVSTGGELSLPEYMPRLCTDRVLRAKVIEDNDQTMVNPRFLALDLSIDELLDAFDYNDIVTVSINGHEWDMPICLNISGIDICPLCLYADPGNKFLFGYEGELIYIASSYESVALTSGVFTETPPENYKYCMFSSELESPVIAEIRLKEKDGYSRLLPIGDLQRTYTRESYPDLTDEEYANFRMIHMGDIAEGVLYRSSNPVDPVLGRNTYADKAAEEHGIKTVLNLADSENEAMRFYGFEDSYYSKQNVLYLDMTLVFGEEPFRSGLAEGLRFMADNEGPYLIHCMEGKYRCGFVSALLECLMGADADEVEKDFLKTYINYFAPPAELQPEIRRLIGSFLGREFGVTDIRTADLAKEAEEYIRGLGLSDEETGRLKARLSGTMPE